MKSLAATFQGQRRLRLREFLPVVGIDASTWSDERLHDLFNTYLVVYEAAWRSFPDAEPCLGALRGVAQVAVLSKGNQEPQEQKLARTGLGRYVDVVLTPDQLGVAKPDPRAFGLACARLGVPARAAVYIGDQLQVDARAGTRAHIHSDPALRTLGCCRNPGGVHLGCDSITARPFFERHGFTVEAEQHPVKAGVKLTNYKMRKELRQGGVPS